VRRPLLLALAVLLAGCQVNVGDQGGQSSEGFEASRQPVCQLRGTALVPQLVLMAQAVPSASQLPCVDQDHLIVGMSVTDTFVRNGRARFALVSDRDPGHQVVQVVLERTCTFGKVTRVPSDHPGIQRYQEVTEIRSGRVFRGAIYYLFRGGCVTYRLDFRSGEQARPLGDVVLALGFVGRDAIAAAVEDESEGRFSLDPPGSRR
jgi:hypothetical protein